jgi:hypothetical protein
MGSFLSKNTITQIRSQFQLMKAHILNRNNLLYEINLRKICEKHAQFNINEKRVKEVTLISKKLTKKIGVLDSRKKYLKVGNFAPISSLILDTSLQLLDSTQNTEDYNLIEAETKAEEQEIKRLEQKLEQLTQKLSKMKDLFHRNNKKINETSSKIVSKKHNLDANQFNSKQFHKKKSGNRDERKHELISHSTYDSLRRKNTSFIKSDDSLFIETEEDVFNASLSSNTRKKVENSKKFFWTSQKALKLRSKLLLQSEINKIVQEAEKKIHIKVENSNTREKLYANFNKCDKEEESIFEKIAEETDTQIIKLELGLESYLAEKKDFFMNYSFEWSFDENHEEGLQVKNSSKSAECSLSYY